MTKKDLQNLENKWKSMNHYLALNMPSGHKHDYIFDRLVWLKKKIDNSAESSNYDGILQYFNETVFFFNKELDLKDDKKFKKI